MGVGGREEGGGAVDGARNWFPAAAAARLQHQQPSGRHQIRTLPRPMTHHHLLPSSLKSKDDRRPGF